MPLPAEKKVVDLEPHEWRPHTPRRDEPFFGPGAGEAAYWLIGFAIMVTATYYFRQ